MIRRAVFQLTVALVLAHNAEATTLITFDSLAHATTLSDEYSELGVILSSTAPLGPELSPDPADSLQPGEAVAPFVFAIVAVPPASTPSIPNKVIGAKYDVGGGLIQCERCGIRITFLDPIPTEVSLFITDADAGQSAQFFGPSGLLDAFTIAPPIDPFELMSLTHPSGISEVLLVSAPGLGIGFDSLQFGAPVPEPSSGVLVAFGLVLLSRTPVGRRLTRRCS